MTAELWGIVAYFIFGALGTACRVAISPTMTFGFNRRTFVEILVGGIAGYLLPYLGTGLTLISNSLDLVSVVLKEVSIPVQILIKGGIVFGLSYGGSFTIGELLARRQ